MIDFTLRDLLIGIAALLALLIILWWQGRALAYLFFVLLFGVYLLYLLSVIVFPLPIFGNQGYAAFKPRINLIPFYFGSCEMLNLCIREIVGNTLLTIPFGFGISFIIKNKVRRFFWLAFAVGLVLEMIQLVISFVFKTAFRAIDINDVLLNATGVLLGYGLFKIFAIAYLKTQETLNMNFKGIFVYIEEVARRSQAT